MAQPRTPSGSPGRPCFNFERSGSCSYGNNCIYSHSGTSKSRGASTGKDPRGKGRGPGLHKGAGVAKALCRDDRRGECNRGNTCIYLHTPKAVRGMARNPLGLFLTR